MQYLSEFLSDRRSFFGNRFLLVLTSKEGNLGKENDAGKFDVFYKTHFYA